jgi:hypothetical protein
MHAMPADTPTPTKRPRRLTFRRVLLAVVLGLAAWWGVGWWLSPKPVLFLRYYDQDSAPQRSRRMPSASFLVELDPQDRVLVWRQSPSADISLDHFDLRSRSTPPPELLTQADYDMQSARRDAVKGSHLLANGIPAHRTDQRDGFDHLRSYPEWKQSVRLRYVSFGPLDRVLMHMPVVSNWLYRPQIGVWHDEGGRFLWSVPKYDTWGGDDGSTYVLTNEIGRFVVFVQSLGRQHEISVMEIPLTSNSPWWSRSAGLLTTSLVLFARRRRRGLIVA